MPLLIVLYLIAFLGFGYSGHNDLNPEVGQTHKLEDFRSKLPPYLYEYLKRVENFKFEENINSIDIKKLSEDAKPILKTALEELALDKDLVDGTNFLWTKQDLPSSIAKVHPSSNLVFELKDFPSLVFKAARPKDSDAFFERFNRMQMAKNIVKEQNIRSVVIPNSELLFINTSKEFRFSVIIEEKIDLLKANSYDEIDTYLNHYIVYQKVNVPKELVVQNFDNLFNFNISQNQGLEYLSYFAYKIPKLNERYLEIFKDLSKWYFSFNGTLEVKPDNCPLVANGQGIAVLDFDLNNPNSTCEGSSDEERKICLENQIKTKISQIGILTFMPMYKKTIEEIIKIDGIGGLESYKNPNDELVKRYEDLENILKD